MSLQNLLSNNIITTYITFFQTFLLAISYENSFLLTAYLQQNNQAPDVPSAKLSENSAITKSQVCTFLGPLTGQLIATSGPSSVEISPE